MKKGKFWLILIGSILIIFEVVGLFGLMRNGGITPPEGGNVVGFYIGIFIIGIVGIVLLIIGLLKKN